MLPSTGRLPLGSAWAYELKWDGIRSIIGVQDGRVEVRSKRAIDITDRFPELGQINRVVADAVFDGEIVVLDGSALDFGATVARLRMRPAKAVAIASTAPATMIAFDLLALDGEDLRRLPYEERRELLEGLRLQVDGWMVPRAYDDGPSTMARSLELGLEGAVAKLRSSRYVSRRSRWWVKERHEPVIDAVVIGWKRRESGGVSLLLAESTPRGLAYIGRVVAPRSVLNDLDPLPARTPPITVPAELRRTATWVKPAPAEVTSASRLPDGRLRHPKLRRIRTDL
jgi:bifunctional non-homologous end joining protein LigD